MKVGILTFHWATNYGAILQCYALQSYLESIGHDVKIIDYKPYRYDDTFINFLKERKFFNFSEYLRSRKKEDLLGEFRKKHLYLTERIVSCEAVSLVANQFDIIISGSDQVANPSFLMNGESHGKISPTYFLGFPFSGKRIGYALSFGCVSYPELAHNIAAKYVKDFDIISVREKTGIDLVSSMGRNDAFVVPDPTLLMDSQFYNNIADESPSKTTKPYIYNFFIRHIDERKNLLKDHLKDKNLIWNNEDNDYSIQGWLSKIKYADFVVTDSFHCVVMCLKLHKPFIVITELKGNVGMNDRFYTLLGYVGLSDCILHKSEICSRSLFFYRTMDWDGIDNKLDEFVIPGVTLLNEIS